MRLTSFKAQGFKSFADAASFSVGVPLIGVVGPNGCGKSNIVDAVRWVLGESRLSALRGRSLPDVLFNGTEARPPADWCGVDLKFANDNSRDLGAWSSYPDIVVRRELGRDGQSFFYINGSSVRRRDVVALFRGTGLSPRAYGVVEQGTIGRVAEASPEELRVFVEEAAGVSHYKENRRETERRLTVSEENLQQVARIAEEVNKQAARLKRQAQQASRYEDLQTRITELDALLLSQKREQAGADLAKLREKLGAQNAEAKKAEQEFEALKTKAQKARAERDAAMEVASKARDELGKTQMAAAAAKRDLENAEQVRKTAAARITEDRDELKALQKRLLEGEKQKKEREKELAQVKADAVKAQREAEDKHKQADDLAHRLSEREHAAQQARAALAAIGGKIKSDEARAQMTAEEAARIAKQLSAAQASLKENTRAAESAAPSAGKAEENVKARERALNESETRLKNARAEQDKAQAEQQEAEKRLLTAQTESEALATVAASAAGEWAHDPPPRLADVLRVEAGEWAQALDAALGYAAGAFAVDDIRAFVGKRGLPPAGAAVVSVAGAQSSDVKSGAHAKTSAPSLLSQLKVPPESERLLTAWLSGVYAAQNDKEALAMSLQLSAGEKLVTRNGVVYETRSVYARGETLGGYDWQRKMKELSAAQKQREKELNAAKANTAKSEQQTAAAEKAREQAAADLEKARHDLSEMRVETTQWRERRANAEKRQSELREEIKALTERQKACQQAAQELKTARAEDTRREKQSQSETSQSETDLKTAAAEVEESRAQAHQASARQQELGARAEELSRRQKEEEQAEADARRRAEQLSARLQQTEKETAASDDKTLRAAAQQKDGEAKQAEARAAKAEAQTREFEKAADDAEAAREKCYGAMQNKQNDIGELRLNERELSLAIGRMNDSLEEADISDARLKELAEERKDASAADTESEMQTLRKRRDAIGGVNFAAAGELREAEERAEELATQIADITAAVAELRAAIRRIDEETKKRMEEMHKRINGEFDALFKKFFGGGDAQLAKINEEESVIDAGFEIRARPPGKRLFSSRALSGGEKAAAALAFVFSMLKLNPPPFCILDEVDAALDERRSDNFVALLKELSDAIQFLVITHNPLTLEQMSRLVGVTQEEKGVSKIVTVNLQQALEAVR